MEQSTYSVDNKKETFVDTDSNFVPHSEQQQDEAEISTESHGDEEPYEDSTTHVKHISYQDEYLREQHQIY